MNLSPVSVVPLIPVTFAGLTGAGHLHACLKKDCERCDFLLSEFFMACDGPCNGFMRKDDETGSYDPATGVALCALCASGEAA